MNRRPHRSNEERLLKHLAPVRSTLERVVQSIHARSPREPKPGEVEADVERLFTLVLEGYRRGVEMVERGLHRAEGVDHELLDEAVAYGLSAGKER